MPAAKRWICVQLGAREHYAVPRGLHAIGDLRSLITDAWARPSGSTSGLAGRFHRDLERADVRAPGIRWIALEAALRAKRSVLDSSEWPLLMSRNAQFDAMARRQQERILSEGRNSPSAIFAYSYSCTSTLASAADHGLHTVMGQIDGGPHEESIVLEEMARYPQLHERYRPAPMRYWEEWRAQCESARRIVVNSRWATHCLELAGVSREKMVILPLYYEASVGHALPRPLPSRFDPSRPLRVLFLGQLNLRKGAARLFEAIRQMKKAPVEFVVVGPSSVMIPEDVRASKIFRYAGRANRSQVHDHYAAADVFLLPTLSDGFALTQLEARAHGLPIIASRNCGEVVSHEHDGLLLDNVTGESIAAAIYRFISNPDMLQALRSNTTRGTGDLAEYGRRLVETTWD